MPFQVRALRAGPFAALFDLPTSELASRGALLTVADSSPGFPCRVSLQDADIGEPVLLTHYEHQTADTPFRASHAIYVRRNAVQANPAPGEVPDMLRSRILSLRGFSPAGMLVAADLADGKAVEAAIAALFARPDVAYLHVHFAKPGCYAARVDRL